MINYSISGTRTNFRDPVEIAFLYAADAGVFVAASAGNSGPTSIDGGAPEPVDHDGRSRHAQPQRRGSVTLGNGVTYSGASVTTAVGPAPFIDSTAAGLPALTRRRVALCFARGRRRTPVSTPPRWLARSCFAIAA